jgi:GTP-binding protein
MKINSAIFNISAADLKTCPKTNLSEFAFIGRSNVGKSSLINSLCDKKDLARVSTVPGKTQLINFYTINSKWSLVDLPGFGYASVGHHKRDAFNHSVSEYLRKRTNLRCIFTLIDSRLEPQPIDLQFIQWLVSESLPYALIFTKVDKQSMTHTENLMRKYSQVLQLGNIELPEMFATSSKSNKGRSELLKFISDILQSAT